MINLLKRKNMTQITLKLDDSLVEGIGKDKIEQKIGFINIRESKHSKKLLRNYQLST